MSRGPRFTVAVAVAFLAMAAPCAVDAAYALHLAFDDHHDEEQYGLAAAAPASVHGHRHEADTPDHDHWTSAAAAAIRGGHALSLASGADALPRPDACRLTARAADGAAPAPSPPDVSTPILRV